MNTSVTGIFPNRHSAEQATASLVAAGFRRERVEVLSADDRGLRGRIASRTTDTARAARLGALVGGLGGATVGWFHIGNNDGVIVSAAIGAWVLALGGGLLGVLVGKSTASQIQAELENELEAGRVLVSVTTDAAHAELVKTILARSGHPCIVTNRIWFRAAILGRVHGE